MKSIKMGLWFLSLLVCFILFYSGYLFHEIIEKHEYDYHQMPTVPKLPQIAPALFQDVDYEDLNMAGSRRNEYLDESDSISVYCWEDQSDGESQRVDVDPDSMCRRPRPEHPESAGGKAEPEIR